MRKRMLVGRCPNCNNVSAACFEDNERTKEDAREWLERGLIVDWEEKETITLTCDTRECMKGKDVSKGMERLGFK